jgi:pyruvate formate lyase activating enzyme
MEKINLGDIVPISTIDWRGKVSAVIFLRGCPLRCVYCQNYNLLEGDNYVEMREIEEELKKSMDFIDAVVLSGGEPFMQPHAIERISEFARKKSLLLGVQTNGFYPEVVESLLKGDLIDKIFLDIKAPLSDKTLYERVTRARFSNVDVDVDVVERVKSTLDVCVKRKIDLELVTTVFRNLIAKEEVKKIAEEIQRECARCPYIIQQGQPEHAMEEEIRKEEALSREELKEMAELISKVSSLEEIRIRTKECGEEVSFKRHSF